MHDKHRLSFECVKDIVLNSSECGLKFLGAI